MTLLPQQVCLALQCGIVVQTSRSGVRMNQSWSAIAMGHERAIFYKRNDHTPQHKKLHWSVVNKVVTITMFTKPHVVASGTVPCLNLCTYTTLSTKTWALGSAARLRVIPTTTSCALARQFAFNRGLMKHLLIAILNCMWLPNFNPNSSICSW